jgi:hypothetical protein
MNIKEMGWKGVDWIRPAQDRDMLQIFVNGEVKRRAL